MVFSGLLEANYWVDGRGVVCFCFQNFFFFFFLRFYASSWLAVVMVITEGCSKLRLCLSLCNSNEDLSLMEFKKNNNNSKKALFLFSRNLYISICIFSCVNNLQQKKVCSVTWSRNFTITPLQNGNLLNINRIFSRRLIVLFGVYRPSIFVGFFLGVLLNRCCVFAVAQISGVTWTVLLHTS